MSVTLADWNQQYREPWPVEQPNRHTKLIVTSSSSITNGSEFLIRAISSALENKTARLFVSSASASEFERAALETMLLALSSWSLSVKESERTLTYRDWELTDTDEPQALCLPRKSEPVTLEVLEEKVADVRLWGYVFDDDDNELG